MNKPLEIILVALGDLGFSILDKLQRIESAGLIKLTHCIWACRNPEETEKIKTLFPKVYIHKGKSDTSAYLQNINCDLGIIASFNDLLPMESLRGASLGFVNLHTSLLPKYRGTHPINWALINDEPKVGVTLHKVESEMDSGDIYSAKEYTVTDYDDINSVRFHLYELSRTLISEFVTVLASTRRLPAGRQQDIANISFAPKRKESDGKIDFRWKTRTIFNTIRALKKPYPEAFAYRADGSTVRLQSSYLNKEVGRVLAKGPANTYIISTGDGVIAIQTDGPLTVGELLI